MSQSSFCDYNLVICMLSMLLEDILHKITYYKLWDSR